MSDNNKAGYERLKNDGTDPKKKDDSTTQVSTDRTCYMEIVNNAPTITNVALTHSSGSTNDVINAATMNNGDSTPPKQISYETGWFADFDYWNISFQMGESFYDTPYNDRCNISYEDAGQTIQCIINENENTEFGGHFNLKVQMPKSSSCNFTINKK